VRETVDLLSSAVASQDAVHQRVSVSSMSNGSLLAQPRPTEVRCIEEIWEYLAIPPSPPDTVRDGDEFVGDNEKINSPLPPTTGGNQKQ
jgi:hypothetical protein